MGGRERERERERKKEREERLSFLGGGGSTYVHAIWYVAQNPSSQQQLVFQREVAADPSLHSCRDLPKQRKQEDNN